MLLVAVVVMLTGTCGVGNGAGGLMEGETAEVPRMLPDGASLEVVEATDALNEALARSARDAPFRRPLAAANVVVSAMLLVGGILLSLLRRSGPWWVTQAVIANILWTCANATSHIWQLQANSGELRRLLRALTRAMESDPELREGRLPFDELTLTIAMRVGLALIAIAVYLWMGWRVRRPDIEGVLVEAERNRGAS